MPSTKTKTLNTIRISEQMFAVRTARGFSQAELGEKARLKRQQINYFETGTRVPSLAQLLQIAQALDVPLQRLLYGSTRPGRAWGDMATELRSLGLVDLWVASTVVPGAFRRPEEVVAMAVSGPEPEARIIEGIPAILAWNRWNGILLRAFARTMGHGVVYRLGWLADVALTIERMGGFPGGCPGKGDLLQLVKRIKKPSTDRWDDLGRPAEKPPVSPIWRRWRIKYAADLDTLRRRAERLVSLANAEGRKLSTWED
jgi:transcriptional regulator with XRE-family HTH domain